MNQPTTRDSRRDKRRRAMLLAASELFTALGFEMANMQAIAASAGVTKATLYAYFGDKEQLFRAVIDYWLEQLPEPELPSQPCGALRSCLERAATSLQQLGEHPASYALTHILLRTQRIPHKRWRQRYRPYQNYLEAVLVRAVRCAHPAQAAGQFLLLAVGRIDSSPLAPSEPRLMAAVDLFVQAYG